MTPNQINVSSEESGNNEDLNRKDTNREDANSEYSSREDFNCEYFDCEENSNTEDSPSNEQGVLNDQKIPNATLRELRNVVCHDNLFKKPKSKSPTAKELMIENQKKRLDLLREDI